MADPTEKSLDLGLRGQVEAEHGVGAAEWAAAGLSIVWVLAVAGWLWTAPEGTSGLGVMLTLLVVFLPLALIWAAA